MTLAGDVASRKTYFILGCKKYINMKQPGTKLSLIKIKQLMLCLISFDTTQHSKTRWSLPSTLQTSSFLCGLERFYQNKARKPQPSKSVNYSFGLSFSKLKRTWGDWKGQSDDHVDMNDQGFQQKSTLQDILYILFVHINFEMLQVSQWSHYGAICSMCISSKSQFKICLLISMLCLAFFFFFRIQDLKRNPDLETAWSGLYVNTQKQWLHAHTLQMKGFAICQYWW